MVDKILAWLSAPMNKGVVEPPHRSISPRGDVQSSKLCYDGLGSASVMASSDRTTTGGSCRLMEGLPWRLGHSSSGFLAPAYRLAGWSRPVIILTALVVSQSTNPDDPPHATAGRPSKEPNYFSQECALFGAKWLA